MPANEYDLILMSLLVFVPSLFALGLVFFPRGTEEWMRWWTLLGTAVTLVISAWVFIDYYKAVYDFNLNQLEQWSEQGSLMARSTKAAQAGVSADAASVSTSDWVARRPWIQQFGIDYYLGIDGISMPLILLTTLLFLLSMIASWN